MRDLSRLPKVGTTLTIQEGSRERLGKILGYDDHGEIARVRWVEYPDLPIDFISTRWL